MVVLNQHIYYVNDFFHNMIVLKMTNTDFSIYLWWLLPTKLDFVVAVDQVENVKFSNLGMSEFPKATI